MQAPELVCLQYAVDHGADAVADPAPVIVRADGAHLTDADGGALLFDRWINDPDVVICGHSTSFDIAVMAANCIDLLPVIFRAYVEGRILCTQLREQLIRTALGNFRGEITGDGWKKAGYSLADLAMRYAGMQLDKPAKDADDGGASHWRLRYGTLASTPLHEWPPGACEYALDDATATRAVRLGQDALAAKIFEASCGRVDVLRDQQRQAQSDFANRLASIWGIRSDAASVAALRDAICEGRAELIEDLQEQGMVRADGTRDMKRVQQVIFDAYASAGRKAPKTDAWNGGIEVKRSRKDGTTTTRQREPWECTETSADACKGADSPIADDYALFVQLGAMLSKDVPMLERGVTHPIHTRFGYAVTGRATSSGPNIQNFGAKGGIRECIVARPGTVIVQLDVPGLELHTFAESAIALVGFSQLGSLLLAGTDVHSYVGAGFAGKPLECFDPDTDEGDKTLRNVAKLFNFGRLGGMGEARFIDNARRKKTKITPAEYKQRNAQWQAALPETRAWFALAKRRFDGLPEGKKVTVEQLYSGRWRGDCGYTDACNTPFQGLGADATKNATFHIQHECYTGAPAPGMEWGPAHIAAPGGVSWLYGCRVINYIHDEWLVEVPDDAHLHERAERLIDVVHGTLNEWLLRVPFKREKFKAVAMRRWNKEAKRVTREGRLQVWEG